MYNICMDLQLFGKKKDPNDTSNDNSFVKRLKEFTWAKIYEPCVWAIQSYKKCSEIKDILRNYIGKNDRLYVFRFDGYSSLSSREINDWLGTWWHRLPLSRCIYG